MHKTTHIHADRTDSITSTADAGGKTGIFGVFRDTLMFTLRKTSFNQCRKRILVPKKSKGAVQLGADR